MNHVVEEVNTRLLVAAFHLAEPFVSNHSGYILQWWSDILLLRIRFVIISSLYYEDERLP